MLVQCRLLDVLWFLNLLLDVDYLIFMLSRFMKKLFVSVLGWLVSMSSEAFL